MEHLYNPDLMSEQEIKQTFVARQGLVDELIALIKRQPDGAGVQHVVIIAPRGMGKTTVLLMVQFALADQGLSSDWQVVRFPEESYSIYDLADFWIETLNHLAEETSTPALSEQAEQLKAKYSNADDLQEAALATIKDWCRQNNKRLVLLVDNFDLILEQINDEQDNASLRNVLMNDGSIMLIGGATTFFKEARAYDQPLYNFFKIYDLPSLKFSDMQELLRQRAAVDGTPHFEETLQANTTRIRVLEYFTGGNPRLVLMLYRVVIQSEVLDVRRGLEKLLDEVTPYYKAKIESLPAQQRKILDHIARVSSQTHEGQTPTEIATATRSTAGAVSSQLKRLSELGYVRAANLRGRNSYYTLSEPLYAIWHQMRFGRDARRRLQWLVDFLKGWYDAEELGSESQKLKTRFHDFLKAGLEREAREALEYWRYLAEAMSDEPMRAGAFEGIICSYLELQDTDALKGDLLATIDLTQLSSKTLADLYQAGCVSEEDISHVDISTNASLEAQHQTEAQGAFRMSAIAFFGKRADESLQYANRAVELNPDDCNNWIIRAGAFAMLGKYEEALASIDRALELDYRGYKLWFSRGAFLFMLHRNEEALISLDHALELDQNSSHAWCIRGHVLIQLHSFEDALISFDRAIEINPNDGVAWHGRASYFFHMRRWQEALESYERAIAIDQNDRAAWLCRASTLDSMSRWQEALESYDRAIKMDPSDGAVWRDRAFSLCRLKRWGEALESYDRTLELCSGDYMLWRMRSLILVILGNIDEAIASLEHALELVTANGEGTMARMDTLLTKFKFEIVQRKYESASQDWHEAMRTGQQLDNWHDQASKALLSVRGIEQMKFARRLISESQAEEIFFPIARALDYLLTGDEALIEKLSPEVRNIVEEIVAKLRPVAEGTKPKGNKKPASKRKPGSRRRTTKQLR